MISILYALQDNTVMTIISLILLWTVPCKGVALWKSARNGQMNWFVVMLVFNTLALVEIVYIFGFQKKNQVIRVKAAPIKSVVKKKTRKKGSKKRR